MGNLLSASRTFYTFIAGFTTAVEWAARPKMLQIAEPPKATLRPEWFDLIHRNHYGRRRLQKLNPKVEQQSMVRDFDLLSTKDTSSWVNDMRDYLGRREMPEHLYIAPEYIHDGEAYRALVTPWYEHGNILDLINKQEVGDERKLDLIKQIAEGLAYLHSLGIVHGNLYPGNVLVKDNGDIVVADAGVYIEVVKLMLLPSGRVPLPQSIDYKCRLDLGGEVPAKSGDVYAFASTCYAVMTGQAPFFEISSPYGRFRKIAHPDGHTTLLKPSSISSDVGNYSPSRLARFRQPAIAGWRNKISKKGWRDLARPKKESEICKR